MKRTAAAFASLVILAGVVRCERNGSPLRPAGDSGMEADYEVIRALVSDTTRVPCPVIVLMDSTADGHWILGNDDRDYIRESLPGLSDETWRNYQCRNIRRVSLSDFRCPGRTVVLLDPRSAGEWERTVPGACGAATVSLAGFNRDGTEALIYWSVYWAPLAAYGSMVQLHRRNGEWVVVRETTIWIS
jgi:hypothetical protein